MEKQTILSIIIPCFNAEKFIGNCLDSILKSGFQDYEIIIVDDGSSDKSRKILKNYECLSQIRIFYLDQNQGPAKARNLGVKNSLGKYLFFLDIDTEIGRNVLEIITDKLEKDQKVGAFQVKLIKGKSQKIDTAGHFLSFSGFPYEIGVGEAEGEHNQETLIFGGRTAGLAIRKELFEKINGFDEDYLIYGEDTDLCWRVWLAGCEVYYLPQAKVYHFPKSSLTKKTKYRIFYEGAKNNTGNILKNANLGMLFWMLPIHLLGWVFISFKLILQKRFRSAVWIYHGLWWNLKNFTKVSKKRKEMACSTAKNNEASKIMFGKISFRKLFTKGWRWLTDV